MPKGCSLGLGFTAAGNFDGASPGGDWPLVLDFENGSYTSASASYALGDVWESDADWFNGGDLGTLVNGVGIVVDGITEHQGFRFADAFVELVAAGPIVVFELDLDGDSGNNQSIDIVGYEATDFNSAHVPIGFSQAKIVTNDSTETALDPFSGTGVHKVALLMSPSRIAVSIDGGAVVGMDNVAPATFERIAIDLLNTNDGFATILTKASFRDPAEGEAALPALSAL